MSAQTVLPVSCMSSQPCQPNACRTAREDVPKPSTTASYPNLLNPTHPDCAQPCFIRHSALVRQRPASCVTQLVRKATYCYACHMRAVASFCCACAPRRLHTQVDKCAAQCEDSTATAVAAMVFRIASSTACAPVDTLRTRD
jgi:hypothetical protein